MKLGPGGKQLVTYLHTHRGPGSVIKKAGSAIKKYYVAGLDLCRCGILPPVKMIPSGKACDSV